MKELDVDFDGIETRPGALADNTISDLIADLGKLPASAAVRRKSDSVYGVRDLLSLSTGVREFSVSDGVRRIVEEFLGDKAKVVRAIYFNKTSEANWKVPWHQDLTIAVKERRDTSGFNAWTSKAGVDHVQPPTEILQRMITLRFHLDDADESNGALKVIPKSHIGGRLNALQIKALRMANESVVCRVKRGDCILMRPLLLHSSSAGWNPEQRRVVHFEFSADELPNGLEWHES